MSSLTEKFMPFRRKINNIITDLLVDGTYQDMMGLQDTNLCSDITILLEDELEEHFNQVELNDISVQVLGKQTRCSNQECIELKETKLGKKNRSKKEICHDIAIFYVRIFNIVSAILTAIDFDNNMCIQRLRALFERTDGNIGKVTVCQSDSKLYPSSFLKVAGMPYLLKLYQMYDLPESSKSNEEKRREIEVLQLNIKKFFKERASDYSADNNLTQTNNEVLSSNIKSKIERIESNVKGVKKGLHNMKDVFEKKGMISDENIQKLDLNGNNQGKRNISNNTANNRPNNTSNNRPNNTSNNRPNNTSNNKPTNTSNNRPNNTSNNRPNNTSNTKNKSSNNNNNGNNLAGLENEEINAAATNINEISGNNEENVINQKGGKNRKLTHKTKNLSLKKSKKKHKYVSSQTGGAGFFQKLIGFIKKPTKSSLKIEEENIENLNNNTVDKRVKNLKKISDLEKIMSRTRVPSNKILKGSDVKIGYVATNLSKKPECASGELNTSIDITDSKMEEFAKKYFEFEKHYYTEAIDLLNFLESTVLKQTKKGKFIIKKFNLLQLDAIERNTREKLLKYYGKCQNLFIESFFELVKALGVKRVSETENNNTNEANELSVEINNLN